MPKSIKTQLKDCLQIIKQKAALAYTSNLETGKRATRTEMEGVLFKILLISTLTFADSSRYKLPELTFECEGEFELTALLVVPRATTSVIALTCKPIYVNFYCDTKKLQVWSVQPCVLERTTRTRLVARCKLGLDESPTDRNHRTYAVKMKAAVVESVHPWKESSHMTEQRALTPGLVCLWNNRLQHVGKREQTVINQNQ